jgi:hypothetical protein
MSEVLNFQWPARGEPNEEEVIPEAWNPEGVAEDGNGVPSEEVLVLYLDRALARRRIEQLGKAYAGALDIIDAQRRRLLALQRQPGNLPPSPPRPLVAPRKTSWIDRLFGTGARREPVSTARKR